ncbi:arylformamidase [Brevibacillus parabrevis]|uniref:arylformamidase n=1 Tax=Brevibacillus parabrevis TaxID=54914 RepID=UPI002E1DE640|nr:arylformamidase [Brevibacillus parabrevis]MED1721903.1 arylformamidase [Brevibacillus parabrevis]
MKLYDISRPLTKATPTWPGDTAFQYTVNWPKSESGSVNVGKLVMSIHTGTHVDAPFHFDDHGKTTLELPLDLYVGAARVVDVSGRASIGADDLAGIDLSGVTRLLLKTMSWSDPGTFPAEICYLRPDLPPFLAEKGIRLLGLDVPSVDPLESKELPAHHGLHQHGIYILEGLLLDAIEPGDYELIALPLALAGADGSPVRAVLRR